MTTIIVDLPTSTLAPIARAVAVVAPALGVARAVTRCSRSGASAVRHSATVSCDARPVGAAMTTIIVDLPASLLVPIARAAAVVAPALGVALAVAHSLRPGASAVRRSATAPATLARLERP